MRKTGPFNPIREKTTKRLEHYKEKNNFIKGKITDLFYLEKGFNYLLKNRKYE